MRSKTKATLAMAAALGLAFAAAAPAGAEVQENAQIPVEIVFDIPCANGGAGETVTLTGTLHVLTTFTINGNEVKGKFHAQPQGVSGFGAVTGDTYHATGVTQGQFRTSFRNGKAAMSFIDNFRLIGQGPGNNYIFHENLHLYIGANGDFSTVVDHLGADCK